jgi:hypothetical protein
MTGIGRVAVRRPRVHDCEAATGDAGRIGSCLLPAYLQGSESIEMLLPILKGMSPATSSRRSRSHAGQGRGGTVANCELRPGDGWGPTWNSIRQAHFDGPERGVNSEKILPADRVSLHTARVCRGFEQ